VKNAPGASAAQRDAYAFEDKTKMEERDRPRKGRAIKIPLLEKNCVFFNVSAGVEAA